MLVADFNANQIQDIRLISFWIKANHYAIAIWCSEADSANY